MRIMYFISFPYITFARTCEACPYLTERYPKVNMNHLTTGVIDKDVGTMSVSDTDDVTDDIRNRQAPAVRQSHSEPAQRLLLLLDEEVTHDRSKALAILFEGLHQFLIAIRVIS